MPPCSRVATCFSIAASCFITLLVQCIEVLNEGVRVWQGDHFVEGDQFVMTHSMPCEQQHDGISSCLSAGDLLHFLCAFDLDRGALKQVDIGGWSYGAMTSC